MPSSEHSLERSTERIGVDPSGWVDRYGDYLFRCAVARLRDPSAAEDVVQETFLAGIENLSSYDGRGEVKFWLRGILRNKIVDRIRKTIRERPLEEVTDHEILSSFLFRVSGVPTMKPAPWSIDVQQAFERREFWEVFSSCIDGLKESLQYAFTLKMLEGMETEEVCKVLGVTSNNLWVMLHRARTQLKQCLEKKWA